MPHSILLSILPLLGAVPESPTVSPAVRAADGTLVHTVRSPLQAGPTEIRVLLPERLEKGKRYPVVYLLPVEKGRERRYGDGLDEVRKKNLHNTLQVIFVAPTFAHLPWYADHPTRKDIAQETYFLQVVLPFVEKHYPVLPAPAGRLLLGFSKSGWGAFTLLLRHPEVFARAAAFDAPFLMPRAGLYGSGEIFGTQENFEKYRIDRLLREKGGSLGGNPRLLLLGTGNFRDHHRRAHALLNDLKVPHVHRDDAPRRHDWHTGWVEEGARWLVK